MEVNMQKLKVIKTKQGRITIQRNSFGIPEIKVRYNGETFKIRCYYQNVNDIEKIVNVLLNSEIDNVSEIVWRASGKLKKKYGI
jgi:hypothetical protein